MPAPEPDSLALVLFGLTYAGLALGGLPGLALDRTGCALLGAVAFLATRRVSLEQAKDAVDAPTLSVLFGMMVLSAQYHLAGLYRAIAQRIAAAREPARLLLYTILAAAALSAVLTNDVVCFVLAPLLCSALLEAGMNPVPFLLALAAATNIGSALTPIGNPQNILIAQHMGLRFAPFVLACALPVLVSLAFLYVWILRLYRRSWRLGPPRPHPPHSEKPPDRREAAKALVLTAGAVAFFLTPAPAHLTALAVAGLVLLSRRMHTRQYLALVDWNTLALFLGLFVVVRGIELSGWTEAAGGWLERQHVDLARPEALVAVAAGLSNLVSNVPGVMLILRFVGTDAPTGHALALASTFAGNAFLVGSIANLIVAEHAGRLGVRVGFREHARVGLPVTIFSLAAAFLAAALR